MHLICSSSRVWFVTRIFKIRWFVLDSLIWVFLLEGCGAYIFSKIFRMLFVIGLIWLICCYFKRKCDGAHLVGVRTRPSAFNQITRHVWRIFLSCSYVLRCPCDIMMKHVAIHMIVYFDCFFCQQFEETIRNAIIFHS